MSAQRAWSLRDFIQRDRSSEVTPAFHSGTALNTRTQQKHRESEMATIKGFTEEHREQLKGMKVGDVLLIVPYLEVDSDDKSVHLEDDSDDESDTQDAEGPEDAEMQDNAAENSPGQAADVDISDAHGEADGASEITTVYSDSEAGAIVVDRSNHEHVEHTEAARFTNEDVIRKAAVYIIQAVSEDEAKNITDITLCEMTYCYCPANAQETSYSIFGDRLLLGHDLVISPALRTPSEPFSIKELIEDEEYHCVLTPKCSARDIITTLHDGRCPAGCGRGWLPSQLELRNVLGEWKRALPDYAPVCPVCMGRDLAMEQYSLREELDLSEHGAMDLGKVVEFMGRLNTARVALGYPFKQFDEREWGYVFDDMLSEDDGDEQSVDGDGGWGYYGEAMDPSGGVVATPAADEAVTALPRKTFAELKESTAEGTAECLICREAFEDAAVVAVMPCGHFFCEEGCLLSWLKQSNSCPACRTKLPAKKDEATFSDGSRVVSTAHFDDFAHFVVRDGFNDDRNPSELSDDNVMDTGDTGESGAW